MLDQTQDNQQPQISSRRDFVRGIGAGALGLSMLGGAHVLGEDTTAKVDLGHDPGTAKGGGCSTVLHSTDRRARLLETLQNPQCTPCDCPPPLGQGNTVSTLAFRTNFALETDCDELFMLPISDAATMTWRIDPRWIREFGPCGPIGYFHGKWTLQDVGADGLNVRLFNGSMKGTIGFNPCAPPGELSCCNFPMVLGCLEGRGRPNSPAQGCTAHWTFCGQQGDNLCDPGAAEFWDVRINGIVQCPCD